MKIFRSYHFFAAVTIVFWSLAYPLTRLSLVHLSSSSLGFLRYFTAAVVLLPIMLAVRPKIPKKKDIPLFIFSGFFGFFAFMFFFNKGQATESSATGSLIIATVPVITALLSRVLFREKLSAVRWIATVIELSGVVVLTVLSDSVSFSSGVFWLFISAVALSVYNLFQRRLTKSYSSLESCAYSIFIGAAFLSVFSPAAMRELSVSFNEVFVYILVLGVFSGAVAFVSWSKAFSLSGNASQVSNYMFITPFLASIFGFLIAHEIPDMSVIIGGGIILAGVLIYNFGDAFCKNICRTKR